mmetsp:Transcript_61434/g.139071  ORF Transcript_61434/g.139071 Transcript_61434/m.139071 type:complete len:245 (+) Transcript_61434:296-1030(+)
MEKAKGKKFFWFSSIARVLMLCYGGSTMIPIMLGSPPAAFMNDAVISITLVSWWLCNCCPGDIFYSTYTSSKLLRGISGFFFEIARCNVCLIWLKKGHAVIPAGGKYYPIPIWGPLLAGTFAGSFGGFVHNGLAAVDSEVTWLVQSAAYVTAAYHFAVFDPNLAPLIQGLAAPFVGPLAMGSAAWTAAWAPLVGAGCALWLAGVAFLQEAVYDKDFNPFSPIHKIAYKVTLVENQKEAAKKKKA